MVYDFRRCDVVNRGFSGYNSRWCRVVTPRVFTKTNVSGVAAFVLFIGANDANRPTLNPDQHVPLGEYQQNILDIVKELNVSV